MELGTIVEADSLLCSRYKPTNYNQNFNIILMGIGWSVEAGSVKKFMSKSNFRPLHSLTHLTDWYGFNINRYKRESICQFLVYRALVLQWSNSTYAVQYVKFQPCRIIGLNRSSMSINIIKIPFASFNWDTLSAFYTV